MVLIHLDVNVEHTDAPHRLRVLLHHLEVLLLNIPLPNFVTEVLVSLLVVGIALDTILNNALLLLRHSRRIRRLYQTFHQILTPDLGPVLCLRWVGQGRRNPRMTLSERHPLECTNGKREADRSRPTFTSHNLMAQAGSNRHRRASRSSVPSLVCPSPWISLYIKIEKIKNKNSNCVESYGWSERATEQRATERRSDRWTEQQSDGATER